MPSPQRLAAIQAIQERPAPATAPPPSLPELWASAVFGLVQM